MESRALKIRVGRVGLLFGMVVGCSLVSCAQTSAWTVKPEWVRAHEEFLASDALAGRGSATRLEEIAANYVASEFISYGLKPAPGMTGYLQAVDVEVATVMTQSGPRQRMQVAAKQGVKGARQTFNAMGYLEGSEPASGTILLTAHLDHLGMVRWAEGVWGVGSDPNDLIYNGANDDAAGTTAVLELAHALASGPKLKRNVLFVCYGSEELGGLGSTYFGAHPPVPLEEPGDESGVRDDREPGSEDAEGGSAADGVGAVESGADAEGAWGAAGAGPVSGAALFSALG